MSKIFIASGAKGISLIELTFAMAIVAITTTMIVPAYSSHQARIHRFSAETCLLDLMRQQEAYFTRHHQYTSDLKSLGYSASSAADCPGTNQYRLSASLLDAEGCSSSRCYRISAIPNGKTAGHEELYLTYNSTSADPDHRILKERGSPGSGKSWP